MGLSLLDLNVSLAWQFSHDNGVFRATKQGRESRHWDLTGVDLAAYDQAIIDEVMLSAGAHVDIDLTDGLNLIPEAVNLTVVETILILATPTDPDLSNCSVILAPGSPNPFYWLWVLPTSGERIPPDGVYLKSYGVGPSGTNFTGADVSSGAKTLKLSNPGPDAINVFYFIGGQNTP